MRRLWLLRHAKSSWDDPRMRDQDRPLSERGRRAAALMAAHAASAEIRPDLVLCSSAARTRETLAILLPSLGDTLRVSIEDDLYSFEAREMLDRLRAVPDDVGSVLVIGHNPGTEVLAARLAADGEDLERMRTKYPTGALATIDLDAERWTDVRPGCGFLVSFVAPGELGT